MNKLPKNWRDLHAYESNYLGSWDLNEKTDTAATISRCAVEDVSNGKTSDRLLVVYFKQFDKGLVMNRTNLKAVEMVAGSSDPSKWVGVHVALYIQVVKAFGETKPAIRIRNAAPPKPKNEVIGVGHERFAKAKQAITEGLITAEVAISRAKFSPEAKDRLTKLQDAKNSVDNADA